MAVSLAAAWLQLSVAVHQLDHGADYIGDACQICIQLDRADDLVVDHAAATPAPVSQGGPISEDPSSGAARPQARLFDSRAPPRL